MNNIIYFFSIFYLLIYRMSESYVYLLLIDIENNILLLLHNQYTTFLSTQVTKFDQPIGNDPTLAAKVASLRLIKEKLHLLTSQERLDDTSLYDSSGAKLHIFIHRINNEEKKLILTNNIVGANFININTLPSNLEILSSAISQAITTYPNLVLNTTHPPSFQPITFPTNITKYNPAMAVPLLMPYDIYQQYKQNIAPSFGQTFQPNVEKKVEPKQNLPIPISVSSPEIIPTVISKPKEHINIIKPPIFNQSNKNIPTPEINNKKYLELNLKYLKYKEKYLSIQQKNIELQNQLNALKNNK